MKHTKIFSFLLLLTLLFSFNLQSVHALDDGLTKEERYMHHSLYYDHMDVKIDVTETGLVKVHTKIDAMFNYSMRGVEIFLPQRYEMTFTDPDTQAKQTKRYYWKVSNLKNLSVYDMNTETVENSALRLRFGDPDIFIRGLHTYEFSYEVQTYDLNYKDLEMFYWDILGDGFDVSIDTFTFEVNLPKPVTENPLYMYSGYFQGYGNDFVEYTFDDFQTIKGQNIQPIPRRVAVTAQIDLPRGYFDYPTRLNLSDVFLGLLGLGTVLSLYWFLRYGKDDPIVVTIEHTAPEGLSSAQVGYIYDGTSDTKDVLSLIVDWASKSLLSIEEIDKKNMRLTKLKDISDDRPTFEKRLFNNLFKSGDVVDTKSLENSFYIHVNSAKNGLKSYFNSKSRRIYNETSNKKQQNTLLLASVLLALFLAYQVYFTTFSLKTAAIFFAISASANMFFIGAQNYFFGDFKRQRALKKVGDLVASLILTALLFLAYYVVLSLFDSFSPKYFFAIILFFIITICSINMSKRTPYGVQNLGKILGLKKFIENAEKERLEYLVHENPQYFFDVLPYAYVLGVSEVWSDKFEDIAMVPPAGFSGNFSPTYYTNQLNRMMYRTTRSMTSVPASTGSSSGGFGGGSFSGGGGGGGFSGGGFGGGGGGGW